MTKLNYDISVQFRKDLMAAYDKIAPTALTQKQAYQLAVKQPAPRYYLTHKQAYQHVMRMYKGDYSLVEKMRPNKKRQYLALFNTSINLWKKRGFRKKSLWHVMQFAVLEPAPEFFVGWRDMQKIFQFVQTGRFANTDKWTDWKEHYNPNQKVEKYKFKSARV